MPRSQQYGEDSLSTRIIAWLRDHPGSHRPADIAAGLGVPDSYVTAHAAGTMRKTPRSQLTIDVGRELSRMYSRGQVARQRHDLRTAGGVRASTYSLPQQ